MYFQVSKQITVQQFWLNSSIVLTKDVGEPFTEKHKPDSALWLREAFKTRTWEKFPTSADPRCGGWELCELGNNVRNLDPPFSEVGNFVKILRKI